MSRGLAVVIGLLLLATALFAAYAVPRQQGYFDPALKRTAYPCSWAPQERPVPLDPAFEGWFSEPLHDVGEPSLFRNKPPDGTTTLRFTFLPAFVEPVIVRVDDLYGDHPRMTAHKVVGQVVQDADNLRQRALTPAEAASIRDFVSSSGVLDLQPDSCLSGLDGKIFLIEANGPGGYRFINRWGVHEGPVYELGVRMFRLTGWPNGAQGPDYSRPLGPVPPQPTIGRRAS